MFKQLASIGTLYENYMIRRGRVEARRILLTQDDKTLFDIGILRHELLGGVKNWPWDGSVTKQHLLSQRAQEFKAIRELNAYSDRELNDLGINRGMINDAVKHGRSGIDIATPKKRPAQTAKEKQAA